MQLVVSPPFVSRATNCATVVLSERSHRSRTAWRSLGPILSPSLACRIMYVEGFFLMVCMPAIELLASRCLEATRTGRRKIFCLNLSAAFVVEVSFSPCRALDVGMQALPLPPFLDPGLLCYLRATPLMRL